MTEVLDRPVHKPKAKSTSRGTHRVTPAVPVVPLIIEPIVEVNKLGKDELAPPVRGYAQNLEGQIKAELSTKNVRSIDELQAQVAKGNISVEDLKKIQELGEKLAAVVKTGEMPFESVEQVKEQLRGIVDVWKPKAVEVAGRILLGFESQYDFLTEQVASIPRLPAKLLQEDPGLIHSLLASACQETSNLVKLKNMPLLISLLYNRSVENLPLEERVKITQELNAESFVFGHLNYVGFEHKGGTLKVEGMVGEFPGYKMKEGTIIGGRFGDYVGIEMSGGRIEGHGARNNVGGDMTGGEICFDIAGHNVGRAMKGGRIEIKDLAGDDIGEGMSGGEIVLHIAGDRVGRNMRGGTILAREVKALAGQGMKGGKMIIFIATDDLGRDMEGGEIEADVVGINAGFRMSGGRIVAKKMGKLGGWAMSGGVIEVGIVDDYIGESMRGGEIYINTDHKKLAENPVGGEVYFEGKRIYNGNTPRNWIKRKIGI